MIIYKSFVVENMPELTSADWKLAYDKMTEWFPDLADLYKQVLILAYKNEGGKAVYDRAIQEINEMEENPTYHTTDLEKEQHAEENCEA
jgi:hypothetical protein